jgi:hypothetical protein
MTRSKIKLMARITLLILQLFLTWQALNLLIAMHCRFFWKRAVIMRNWQLQDFLNHRVSDVAATGKLTELLEIPRMPAGSHAQVDRA